MKTRTLKLPDGNLALGESPAETTRKKYLLILPLLMAIVFLALSAQTSLGAATAFISEKASEDGYQKDGDDLYARRAEGYTDGVVDPTNIKKALAFYHKGYALGDDSEEMVIKIMRATYFYAIYAESDSAKQKKAFSDVIELGEETLADKSSSAALNYHLAVAWGSWGDINGIFASARKGIADKVKELGEKVIKLDPAYAEGGGYRTMGRLHFMAPRIPFFLSWPSKKKSQGFLEKAIKLGPTNITNHLFLAETLYANGKKELALRQIDYIERAKVNPTKKIEDLRDKKDAQILKKKITGK
jgi:hypothetical protein